MDIKKQLLQPLMSVLKTFSGDETTDPRKAIQATNVFGFYSPTGGTGVTTFVVNLATVLAEHAKVAVLDLDIFYPSAFRFLLSETDENSSLHLDVFDKFLASGSDVVSYGHETRVPNVTLFSCLYDADITKYCDINMDGVYECIRQLSQIYEYVLIDINGYLNDEATLAAIESCTRVYSFIRPSSSDLERIYKDTLLLTRYGVGAKTKNIIQTPVGESTLDPQEIIDAGLLPVMNIPYVKTVENVGYNFDIFVKVDGGSNKASRTYIECCKYLAERIANYEIEVNADVSI